LAVEQQSFKTQLRIFH